MSHESSLWLFFFGPFFSIRAFPFFFVSPGIYLAYLFSFAFFFFSFSSTYFLFWAFVWRGRDHACLYFYLYWGFLGRVRGDGREAGLL
jgi:hypothetical protein